MVAAECRELRDSAKELETMQKGIVSKLTKISEHRHCSPERKDAAEIERTLEELLAPFLTSRRNYLLHAKSLKSRIGSFFTGKASAPSADKIAEYRKIAEERIAQERPPGYRDGTKPVNAEGDALIWLEILDRAQSVGRPVIVVTDDTKPDWWLQSARATRIGPRPELVAELRELGLDFWIYDLRSFMKFASREFNVPTTEDIQEELNQAVDVDLSQVTAQGSWKAGTMLSFEQDFWARQISHRVNDWELLAAKYDAAALRDIEILNLTETERTAIDVEVMRLRSELFDAEIWTASRPCRIDAALVINFSVDSVSKTLHILRIRRPDTRPRC